MIAPIGLAVKSLDIGALRSWRTMAREVGSFALRLQPDLYKPADGFRPRHAMRCRPLIEIRMYNDQESPSG